MNVEEEYLRLLPPRLAEEIEKRGEGLPIEEIRIRRGMPASLTVTGGKNLRLRTECTGEETEECLNALCGGSLHAHAETLRQGYVSLAGGMRAAVVGRAWGEEGKVMSVRGVSSICLRIPRTVRGNAGILLETLEKSRFSEGILLYSRPGEGKTTLLRETASRVSSAPYLKRTALIDAREELYRPDAFRGCLCDVLTGYPKAEGISIAVRCLSPQVIVCDEIGGREEAGAILSVHCAGVPLIASVHGDSVKELKERPGLGRLLRAGVFPWLCRLTRDGERVECRAERFGG